MSNVIWTKKTHKKLEDVDLERINQVGATRSEADRMVYAIRQYRKQIEYDKIGLTEKNTAIDELKEKVRGLERAPRDQAIVIERLKRRIIELESGGGHG